MEENKKRKFVGNATWMIIQKIYAMLVSLIVGSLSARYLGPSNYGVMNYGASIIAVFLVISNLGLDSTLVSEMIKRPDKQGSYIGTSIILRLVISVLSIVLTFLIIRSIEPDNQLIWIVTFLQSTVIVFNIYEVLLYWFQMRLEMKYVSIATMISATITGAWRIYLLASGRDVIMFSMTSSIAALVTGVVVIVFFCKKSDFKLCVNLSDGWHLLSNSYHFIISSIAIVLYMQIDKTMLGKWVGNESVGYYSAASTIATLWEFIPLALVDSSRPIILEKMKKDYEGSMHQFKTLLFSINIMAIIVGVFIMLFGKYAIFILYGDAYNQAIPAMNILIWSTSFAVIGSARTIWIVGTDKNRYTKYYVIIGAITNIVLNAIFIPHYGIIAAAITTLISQIVVAVIAPLFFSKTREFFRLYIDSFTYFSYFISFIKGGLRRKK